MASLHDVEILGINVIVLGKVIILLGNENTLTEEVFMDLLSVGLWDKPGLISKC